MTYNALGGRAMDYATLLLVDDDADLLGLLQRRLEDAGYEVVVAEGGPQALVSLTRRWPDLAIVDLLMPTMDGFQVAEEIKRRGDIPVIFLTSVQDTRTRIEGIRR
ncbi:MAG: response regulator, partial [Anaerolineales bacterium]|nr:response regulator [Anaerolineales bacterium]